LTPRISAVTGFSREGYPVMSTREAQTTVRLRDGEALAIGGLIRDETNESRSGLPWLSSLGFLGRLFGSQSKQAKRTEVVILLTPRIVDPERNNRE
jgi:type II secretory pathway component GspD/PulD (secretin)